MIGPEDSVHRFSHQAMGTAFEVLVSGEEKAYAGQAAREVFREIDRLERMFSRFDPGSDIARINRLRPGEETLVGWETFECLSAAEDIRRETEGAFDINARARSTSGTLSGPGGRAEAGPPSSLELPAAFELIRDGGSYAVRRPKADPSSFVKPDLDLGAIGKGYALDRIRTILGEWGLADVLLDAGTSTVLAWGSAPAGGAGWPVGVGAGWPGAPSEIRLSERALSGSGTEIKGAHLLDPRTGEPARSHLAAWVSASSAAEADALSTALFVMKTEEAERFVLRRPEIWACLVVGYGDVRILNPDLFPRLP